MHCLNHIINKSYLSSLRNLSETSSLKLKLMLWYAKKQQTEVLYKKGVIKIFAIFTGKHLCWSLFLLKCNFIKKRLEHRCFPVNITKFLRTHTYFEENLRTAIPFLHLLFLSEYSSKLWDLQILPWVPWDIRVQPSPSILMHLW